MLYRAYWAIPRTLKTNAGEQVNTVFGFASMLLNILANEKPDAVVVAFDEGNETVRHQADENYKAGRAETPDDFYPQVPRTFELLDAFQLTTVSDTQYEADDFLAAYALAAKNNGMQATIVSGDKDLFQLAQEGIRIAIPHKGYQAVEYLGASEVEEKLGVRPDQVTAFKGLAGDSSDNLPGVQGIGPVGAAKLLQQYETLEGIYEHLDDISKSQREKLERDKEQAFFCQKMATLHTDIPLPLALDDTSLNNLPTEQIFTFFSDLDFTLLKKRLLSLLDTEYGKSHFDSFEGAQIEKAEEKSDTQQLSLFG